MQNAERMLADTAYAVVIVLIVVVLIAIVEVLFPCVVRRIV